MESLPQRLTAPAKGMLALLVAASAGIAWWASHGSEGFGIDSMFYLSQAHTLEAGGPMQIPDGLGGLTALNHWPPLYPALLALIHIFGPDGLGAARVLNIALFPLNTLLVFGLAYRASCSPAAALISSGIFVLAPSVMEAHAMALSESLCLCLWLLSLLLLVEFSKSKHRTLLLLAAVIAGLSILTRYAAIAQLGAGAVCISWHASDKGKRRYVDAIIYLIVGVLPLVFHGFWQRHEVAQYVADPTHQAVFTERHLAYYGFSAHAMRSIFIVLQSWLCPAIGLPLVIRGPIMAAMVVALGTLIGLLCRSRFTSVPFSSCFGVFWLAVLNLVAYSVLLLATAMFYDPDLDLSARMHLPNFVFCLIIFAAGGGALYSLPDVAAQVFIRKWTGFALGAYLLVCLLGAAVWLRNADTQNLGFAVAKWRNTSALPLLKNLPTSAPVYSNQIKIIYFLTGRTDLHTLPSKSENPETFNARMAKITDEMGTNHGSLVFFTENEPSFLRGPSIDDLKNGSSFRIVAECEEAIIFQPASMNSAH